MNNYQLFLLCQKLQLGIMIDKIVDLKFAKIAYCEGDNSAYWNMALVNQLLTKPQLQLTEKTMISLDRQPAVYFENRQDLAKLATFLTENHYQQVFEDSWLFYGKKIVDQTNFDLIKKVTNERELQIFISTFDRCYQKNDPQNPYGELGDYLKIAEKAWRKFNKSNRLQYFLAYKNDHPVAVGSLTNLKPLGYISNIGSLREVRGQGFGKLISLYCTYQSMKNNNTSHFLITEEGENPYDFYHHIGFVKKFSAPCYLRKK